MSNPVTRPGSEEEWEELMRQLHRQAQPHPRPFFYARVQARLATEQPTGSSWLRGWVQRPAYLALLGALVLAVSGDGAALPPVASGNHDKAPHPGQAEKMVSPRR